MEILNSSLDSKVDNGPWQKLGSVFYAIGAKAINRDEGDARDLMRLFT